MLSKLLKRSAPVLIAILIAMQFVRPAKTNPPVDASQMIQAHTQMTPEVAAILTRACQDCHSAQTHWPWYSQVAPVSWFVINHVNEGRHHLNFSDWAKYDRKRRLKKLAEIAEEVRERNMPLSSYTLLHSEAKLSEADIGILTNWAHNERQRLEATSPE